MNLLDKVKNTLGTSLSKKVIRTTIRLVDDTFKDGESNVLTIEGLRTLCVVTYGNGLIMPTAHITIYGLSMDVMNKLVRIRWQDMNSMRNMIKVEAGEQAGQLFSVYDGNITFAYIDTSSAPNIALRIQCVAAVYEAYKPATPVSYKGRSSVVGAISGICEKIGFTFENNGVPETLYMEDVTLTDTDINKIRRLCSAYKIEPYIESNNIAITPQGGARGLPIPVITPESGLIGYPVPTIQGVDLKCFFDPMIRFGGIIRIKDSLIETTNGDWRLFGVTINLESELPNGNWFMDLRAAHRGDNNVAISRA